MHKVPDPSRRRLLSLDLSPQPQQSALVHIASLLVQVTPPGAEAIRAAVASLAGAELHLTSHLGKFAVVLESTDERSIADAAAALSQIPGVLTVSIVSHLIEDAAALAEDAP